VKYIENFLEISDSDISKKIVSEYLHLIDGFTHLPIFNIHYLENKKLCFKSIKCLNIDFTDFNNMISQIKKLRNNNHIILYEVKPFCIRIAKIPLSYDILGYNTKTKRREEKINQLLNEE
jgi:hypothetical protein